VIDERNAIAGIRPVAERWAAPRGWQIVDVSGTDDAIRVEAVGPPPNLDSEELRRDLDAAGFAEVPIQVSLVEGGVRNLPTDGG
jgi:hypothetical protein